tara:strand:- start:14902 stop:15156 length:255 start_codon:yes stop_codon:yes gene_type:complete
MELKEIEMRLDNLEKQVGEILSLASVLPRLEERMVDQRDRVKDHEARLRDLEQSQQKNNIYVGWVERAAWMIMAGIISGIAFMQ